jgi:hypothetical protein
MLNINTSSIGSLRAPGWRAASIKPKASYSVKMNPNHPLTSNCVFAALLYGTMAKDAVSQVVSYASAGVSLGNVSGEDTASFSETLGNKFTFPHLPATDVTGDLTMFCRISPQTPSLSNSRIITKTPNGLNMPFELFIDQQTLMLGPRRVNASTAVSWIGGSIVFGSMGNYAATMTTLSANSTNYSNGVSVSIAPTPTGTAGNATDALGNIFIGDTFNDTRPFKGDISLILVFNRVLNSTEIGTLPDWSMFLSRAA